MASNALQGLNNLATLVSEDISKIQNLKAQIRNCDDKVNALVAAKYKALDELRNGLYCSQCHRTKTEIEAGGENFWEHLRRVNGVPLPAPQSEIDAKAREFDGQIAALTEQMEAQKKQYASQIKQLQSEIQEASLQIQQGIHLWETATTFEHDLIRDNEVVEKGKTKVIIDYANRELREAESARNSLAQKGADRSSIDQANSVCEVWRAMREKAQQDDANKWSSYLTDIKTADETKTQEYVQIKNLLTPPLGTTGDAGGGFSVSGLADWMPTKDLSIGRVSLNLSPTQLGAGFKFGSLVSSGFTAGEVDPATLEARTFIDLVGKVRLSVGWRTQDTPEGVLSYPTMDLTLKPSGQDGRPRNSQQSQEPTSGLPPP
jgi:hypothetical protein